MMILQKRKADLPNSSDFKLYGALDFSKAPNLRLTIIPLTLVGSLLSLPDEAVACTFAYGAAF